jgi:hypothetical protein
MAADADLITSVAYFENGDFNYFGTLFLGLVARDRQTADVCAPPPCAARTPGGNPPMRSVAIAKYNNLVWGRHTFLPCVDLANGSPRVGLQQHLQL